MAAGGSLESTLDRKFQAVTNTMDSIQGLSTWCIDNKKYHSLIVRHWIKVLKKSESAHRLNLIYLANDIIQNCKRKNAIVYRTAFAEVLRDAFVLLNSEGDPKVIKSVERILSIWEDRSVYSGTLITELRNSLVKEESPPETPVEQKTPVESKADLRSKVLAEFVPQALIDQLSKCKRSLEDVDLREKQLAAMRVDICSTEALRKLKDKAGGKKFSKDFEEGSAQLQEFVKFLDKESKKRPPLMEALSNADVFYEMQYKEVKIVANAYQTFANRVTHLKRKLDALKANLPDLDESPIPSPSADAPSPTGSESPFHGMELAHPDPDLDGSAMDDDAEPPAPSPLSSLGGSPKQTEAHGENDRLEVEDMELSDEETDTGGIIVEEEIEHPSHPEVPDPVPAKTEPSVAAEQPVTQVTPPVAAPTVAVENVDLGKIGSILSSLKSVIKNTGPAVESPPAATSSLKTTPAASLIPQDASSIVSLLSKVDVCPADLLGALSKVHGKRSNEGITSLLSSPAVNVSSDSSSTGKVPPSPSPSRSSTSASTAPSQSLSLSSVAPSSISSTVQQSTSSQPKPPPQTANPASALVQALHRDMDLITDPEPSSSSQSLESKIHNFLQGNSAFSAFDLDFPARPAQGGNNLSPVPEPDTQEGTPVRDEGGGTPTQDEIMDTPVTAPFSSSTNQKSSVRETFGTASVAAQQNPSLPHLQPGVAQNGQVHQQYQYGGQERSEHGITAPVAHFQQIPAPSGGPVPGERAPGGASSTHTAEGFHTGRERGWYGDSYPEGGSQQPRGYNVAVPGVNQTSGLYPYQTCPSQKPPGFQQGPETTPSFFPSSLPPVPNLPPRPQSFDTSHAATNSSIIPQEQQLMTHPDTANVIGPKADSVVSGMVVHDHQHKSMFHPDDASYGRDRPHLPHLEEFRPHPDDLYHDNPHHNETPFFQDDPYHHPEDPYYRPASPSHHYNRVRGRLTPSHSPSEDPYYAHEYQRHSPPPPHHYTPRRPPPPHHPEIHHPGLRPPHRPPHPAHHPRPRGPPGLQRPPRPPFHPQFQHGPDPRLRGKRPVPRRGGDAGPMFPPKRPFPPPRY